MRAENGNPPHALTLFKVQKLIIVLTLIVFDGDSR